MFASAAGALTANGLRPSRARVLIATRQNGLVMYLSWKRGGSDTRTSTLEKNLSQKFHQLGRLVFVNVELTELVALPLRRREEEPRREQEHGRPQSREGWALPGAR